jgi:UTP-glucose-1-phosphate uridylyltransferase
MSKPTLVVMAAGIGSRYGGLKQIDPVGPNGEIIIDYSIYDALNAGFGKVVFVIKEDIKEPFRERVGKTIEKQCETTYVFQKIEDVPEGFEVPLGRQKPWGTGHATLSCRNVVHSPFAVINADDFY